MPHVVDVSLDFHEQHNLVIDNTNKDYLYINTVFFSSVSGLNLVLSIYMGLPFGEVVEG
jgi:hypothetical protein